ncbi:2-keto-4-pentenoate hydratase [Acinetobacter sp. WZC-1]|uniref:2-keto-4-pentenoate hydratase n=1 Tax=Acinetobacter sp. WZC-1 TaxID=3459034 RepID=UPI00403DD093
MTEQLREIAGQLDQARIEKQDIASICGDNYTLEQAFEIQNIGVQLREQRGEKQIGVKLGFTSHAKMKQMGIDKLIFGRLTDAMLLNSNDTVDVKDFIHPRIEPEIGFVTARDITEPLSLVNYIYYIDGIFPAMEIIDSRYQNFKFTLADVVADNTSAAAFVLGEIRDFSHYAANMGVILSENGHAAAYGSTAAILGNPILSLIQVSQILSAQGQTLPAGSLILAGAATNAIHMQNHSFYETQVHGLGTVSINTAAN